MAKKNTYTDKELRNRRPTPYEVSRDAIQIESNVLLTIAIILLMVLQIGIWTDWERIAIILITSFLMGYVFAGLKKFKKNWTYWLKK